MPITYALNTFALAIATLASLIVWASLEHGDVLLAAIKKPWDLVRDLYFNKDKPRSKTPGIKEDVPMWWYVVSFALGLFFSIFSIEFWGLDLRWYGVLFSLLIGGAFFYPVRSILLVLSFIRVKQLTWHR